MEVLLLTVILGLGFAFFATQNITPVIVNIASYSFNVPLYIVVIVSLMIGLILSSIIALVENMSANFTIWGKEKKINQARERIVQLNKHIDELERENSELKAKRNASGSVIRPA